MKMKICSCCGSIIKKEPKTCNCCGSNYCESCKKLSNICNCCGR